MHDLTKVEIREGARIAGEMAAQRLYDSLIMRLEELQESEGLTQTELASRIGVSPQQLSRWLTHTRNMNVKSAGRVAAGLKTHLGFELEPYEAIENSHNAQSGVTPLTGNAGSEAPPTGQLTASQDRSVIGIAT